MQAVFAVGKMRIIYRKEKFVEYLYKWLTMMYNHAIR